jgi:hypothetical protein
VSGSIIVETLTATATATATATTKSNNFSTERTTERTTITETLTATATSEEITPSTSTSSTSSTSTAPACATPSGQFAIQLQDDDLYLTGDEGGAVLGGTRRQKLVITSDCFDATQFTAAEDGQGQVTTISADGTTLFSNQLTYGNGPIFWGKRLRTAES